MRDFKEAQQILQTAYDIDIGKRRGSIDPTNILKKMGTMDIHIGYYDSGLAQTEEIQEHLRNFPNGQFSHLIQALRDARIGEYDRKTLNKMYGLI